MDRFEAWLAGRLTARQATAFPVVMIALALIPTTVAAQATADAESMMCGTGIGPVLGLVFVVAALFFLVKAGLKFMSALDKMNSTNKQTSYEGKEGLSDAGTTAAAAFVPGLLAGFFEVMNVQTVSCLAPQDWSIIGTIVVHLA
jgi:hypothetical protein